MATKVVCELCGQCCCDGKLWITEDRPESDVYLRQTECTNKTFLIDGVRYIRYVRGMGEEWNELVFPTILENN